MHAPQEPIKLDEKLATQSPWLLIAILLHVVVVAIASVLYYETGSALDDVSSTEISITTARPPVAELVPPTIVDYAKVPQPRDDMLEPSDLPFESMVSDEPPLGDVSDSDTKSEFVGMPECGSTPIGPSKGWHASVPSPNSGPPGGKSRGRPNGKPDGGGRPGGTPTNEAVDLGLLWLKNHQDEDGHWDADQFMKHDVVGDACTGPGNSVNDVGVTGLALLAFLGVGNTLKDGPHRKVVRSGVRWLLEQQDADSGLIGTAASQSYMYSHAIAALAVCEAYGLSDHRPLRKSSQAAINYIVQSRNPYGVWRYQPRDNDGDSSVTAWMVQALLSGKEFGLLVDDAALQTAAVFFDGVTDAATGTAGYTKAGEGSSRPVGKQDKFPAAKTESLTSAVLLCRCLLHQEPKDTPTMSLATEAILKKPPVWNETDGSIDMYYWYYASYALFQIGGKPWETWSKKMNGALVKTQRKDGNAKGSWDPVDAWGEEGGRIYSTAIMVLCLEAHYRYSRVLGAR